MMGMTPQEIQEKHFHDTFRGYSHEEVDLFLDEVAVAFERLYRENQSFMRRVVDLEEQVKRVQEQPSAEEPVRPPQVFDEEAAVTETTLKRMLLIAQETADKAVQEARVRAREIQDQARTRSDELINSAEQRVRELNSAKIEKERELQRAKEALRKFDQQYRTSFRVFIESQLEALQDLPAAPAIQAFEGGRAEVTSSSPVDPQAPLTMDSINDPFETVAMQPVEASAPSQPISQRPEETAISAGETYDDAGASAFLGESESPDAQRQTPGAAKVKEPEPDEQPGGGAPSSKSEDPELVRPLRAREKSADTPGAHKDADEDKLIRELFWGDED